MGIGAGLSFINGLLTNTGVLSLPQNISTTASPTFNGLTLSSLTLPLLNKLLYTDNTGLVSNVGIGAGLSFINGLLTNTGGGGGISSIVGTANQINVTNNGGGNITLSTPQSIGINNNVQFAKILDSSIGSGNQIFGTNTMSASSTINTVAIGNSVLPLANNSSNNVAIGYNAGNDITTGSYNCFIGDKTGLNLTTGNDCNYIGSQSWASSSNVNFETVIGSDGDGRGENTMAFYAGNGFYFNSTIHVDGVNISSLHNVLLYTNNTGLVSNVTVGSGLSFINGLLTNTGVLSLPQNISTTSSPTFAKILDSSIGSGNQIFGTNTMSASSTINTVAIGNSVLPLANNSSNNVAIGYNAGNDITTGSYNCFIGDKTGLNLTTGNDCNYIGSQSWASSSNVNFETVIGSDGDGRGENTMAFYAGNGFYFNSTIHVDGVNISSLTDALLYTNNIGNVLPVTIGSGLSFNFNTGTLIATGGGGGSGVSSITGTANQINVDTSTGAVTLSLPQDINTTSNVQFARILDSSIGNYNQIFGSNTLSNSSNTYTVAIGNSILPIISNSYYNVAIGYNVGNFLTEGSYNCFIGASSGGDITTCNYCNYIGVGANSSSSNVSFETVIGIGNGNGSNTVSIYGSSGCYFNGNINTPGVNITSLTDVLLYANNIGGISEVTFGGGLTFSNGVLNYTSSPAFATILDSSIGSYNQIFGSDGTLSYSSNAYTVAIGTNVLPSITNSINNIAIGFASGHELLTGSNNCFIGVGSGRYINTCNYCNYIGTYAVPSSDDVSYETVIGKGGGHGSNTVSIYGSSGCYFNGNINAPGIIISSLTNALLYTNDSDQVSAVTVGSGLSFNNGVLIATGGSGFSGVSSVNGTANQVIVSPASVGDVTLSLPQSIAITSSPTFNGLRLSGLLVNKLLYINGTGVVSNVVIGSGLVLNSETLTNTGVLSLPQDISITSSPTFAGLTLTSLTEGLLYINSSHVATEVTIGSGLAVNSGYLNNIGVLSIGGTANQVNVNNSNGAVTLNLPQDIATASSPTFAKIQDSSIGLYNQIFGSDGTLSNSNNTYTVAIGNNTLSSADNSNENVAVGYFAGNSLTSGSYNCFIGAESGRNITTGNYCNYIGFGANASSSDVNYETVIGIGGGNGSNTVSIYGLEGCYFSGSIHAPNIIVNSVNNALLYANDSNQVSPVTVGSGLSFNNGVLIATGGSGFSGVSSVNGTANQVIVSPASVGDVTLSLPQSIAITSSPTFNGLRLSGLLVNKLLYINGTGVVSNVVIGSGLVLNSGTLTNTGVLSITGTENQINVNNPNGAVTLSLPQDIATASSPTFAGLTLTPLTNVLLYTNSSHVVIGVTIGSGLAVNSGYLNNTGILSVTGTANQINVNNSNGEVTLNLPQDISNESSPTFAGLTLTPLTNVLLYTNSSHVVNGVTIGSGLAVNSGYLNNTGILSVMGTANQINVNNSNGAVTLSLPQDIATTSNVQFARILNSSIGLYNQIIGTNALPDASNTYTVSIGNNSLNLCSNSTLNIAIGNYAGFSLNSGSGNCIIGGDPGLMSGNGCIYIGRGAKTNTITNNSEEIVIGNGRGNGIKTATIIANNGVYTDALYIKYVTVSTLIDNSLIYKDSNTGYLKSASIGSGLILNVSGSGGILSNTGVLSITGNTNQIYVNNNAGAVTIYLPQDIATTSYPTFAGLTLSGTYVFKLSTISNKILFANNGGVVNGVSIESGLIFDTSSGGGILSNSGVLSITGTANQINANVSTGAVTLSLPGTPTLVGLTLTSVSNAILYVNSTNTLVPLLIGTGLSINYSTGTLSSTGGNIVSITGTANQINVTNNSGNIRLSTPQDISLNATPSFQTLYITGYKGYMLYTDPTSGKVYPVTPGTGLTFLAATGRLTNTGATSITGTANQIYANVSTGAITLTLPQDINTTSTPSFDALTLNLLNTNSLVYSNDTHKLTSVGIGSGLDFSNGVLSATGSGSAGVSSITGTVNQIYANNSTGSVTLYLPQDIATNSNVQFNNLTIGSLLNSLLCTNNLGLVSNVLFDSGISFSSGTLSLNQDISTNANVTFTGLTLTLLTNTILYTSNAGVVSGVLVGSGLAFNPNTGSLSNSGVMSITGTTNQVNVSTSNGVATLSLPSIPVISKITLTQLTNTILYTNSTGLVSNVTVGSGLSFNYTTGTLTATGTSSGVSSITGTANQIYADVSTGAVTLNLPQSIAITSSPTFAGLTLTPFTNVLLCANSSHVVNGVTVGTGLSVNYVTGTLTATGVLSVVGTANQINVSTVTGVATLSLPSTPVITGLTLSSLTNTMLYTNNVGLISALTPGTGLSFNYTTGTLTATGVLSVVGTTNQINVNTSNGVATLSLPSAPVISGVTLTSFSNVLLYANSTGVVSGVTTGAGLTFNYVTGILSSNSVLSVVGTANQINVNTVGNVATLSTPQDIGTASTPTFYGLTLSGLGVGILSTSSTGVQRLIGYGTGISYNTTTNTLSNSGVTSIIGTSGQTIVTNSTGLVQIQLPQSISGTSSPTFAGLTLTGFSNGIVYLNNAGVVSKVIPGAGLAFDYNTGILSSTNAVPGVSSIIGTANQIYADNSTGVVTLTLPQSIATNSNVQFANLTISSMSNNISNGVSLGNSAGTAQGGVFIGDNAGNGGGQTTPYYSTSIGYLAGKYGGSYGVSIGSGAGYYMYGRNNICIGNSGAGAGGQGGNNNIYIGNVQSQNGYTSNETVIGGSYNSTTFGKGSNTAYIIADSGCYFSGSIIASNARLTSLTNTLLYANDSSDVSAVTLDKSLTFTAGTLSVTNSIINLWNNNATVVNHVEQWILNSASGIANIGSTPTITSGVITNIPVGVYEIVIYGSVVLSNNTHSYPQIQYKSNGGSFVTLGQTPLTSNGGTNSVTFSITSYVRISNILDAIQLYYNPTAIYTELGTDPIAYNGSYLPRYLSIKYISA